MKILTAIFAAFFLLSLCTLHAFDEDFWINTTESVAADLLFINNIAASPCGRIFAGTSAGFWKSDNRGETWIQIPISDRGIFTGAQVLRDGTIVAGGRDSLHFSSDCGDTWTTYTHLEHGIPRIDYFRFVEREDGTLYSAMQRWYKGQFVADGTWVSHDRGASWELVCDFISNGAESMCIALHPNGDVFWGSWRWKGLFVLRNGDDECHNIYSPGGFGEREWDPLDMGINSKGQILVSTDRVRTSVFTSSDTGRTWTPHDYRFDDTPSGKIRSILVDRFDNFIVGMNDEVWYTANFAETWTQLPGYLEFQETIYSMCLDSSDYLYVGTQQGRIYRSREPIYTATGIKDNQLVNSKLDFSLSPNPTTGDLTLNFTLETQGLVTAELFDMRGALVKQVFQREYAAGSHRTTNKMDFVKSGVYVLRVKAGARVLTRLVTVLR